MMLLVYSAFALMCFIPFSSQECYTETKCLPEMPFPGANIWMKCDVACYKCLRLTSGWCTKKQGSNCYHKCTCYGVPVMSRKPLKRIDEEYCNFVKRVGRISTQPF